MSNLAIGLILSSIILALMGVEIACNKYIKKVTNTYWFWLGIAIVYLVYCIVMCWQFYWREYAHTLWGLSAPEGGWSYDQQKLISHAFILNLCPMINFILPTTLIADPSRKAARGFAPIAILASTFVLLLALPLNTHSSFTWRYIFIGETSGAADLFFLGHSVNFLIAFGVLLNTPRYGWKGTVASFGSIGLMYLYTTIVSYTKGACFGVSGVHYKDFGPGGTFSFFNEVLHFDMHVSQAIFFILMPIALFGIILLADLCKKGWCKYGDQYSGTWWRWYNYDEVVNTKPWGWFSDKWQSGRNKNQLWFRNLKICKTNNFYK